MLSIEHALGFLLRKGRCSVFGLLPSVGPWELILILAIALIIFGPGKLPEVGKALGKGIREFRSAAKDIADQASIETTAEETKPTNEPNKS